jgi:hypothetical protein
MLRKPLPAKLFLLGLGFAMELSGKTWFKFQSNVYVAQTLRSPA